MGAIITILFLLMRILDFITTPLFKYRARNNRHHLPPFTNDVLRISATHIARKIRNGELSSIQICEAYIQRIKEVNPILNAVVEERFKEALHDANLVDEYLKTTSLNSRELSKIKPLLGVPITIKESCSVKGMSLCVGLKSRVGYKASVDGEVVARLKTSGAIILLVSNTPEMSYSWETFNNVTGYTNNPYDTTCTAGGSSGGEGALLGSAASLVGIGSDIAGSIRLPALFNGIFGHKPTPRVISIKGHWPQGIDDRYQDFLVIGPLTRYASDLNLMMKVMCSDKWNLELKLNKEVQLSKLKVFYVEDIRGSVALPKVSPEMREIVRCSVKYLWKNCGVSIMDYHFPEFSNVHLVCISELFTLKDIPNAIKWENASYPIELIKSLIGKSKFSFNLMYSYFVQGIYKYAVGNHTQENLALKEKIISQLGTNGVIILPTSIGSAHKHNQMYFKNIYSYLVIANALGLPSTHVPCGFDRSGLPIGVQILAAPYQDRLCLAVAQELERCFGGWVPPPEETV
ncbi:fatty-acid amide hydrolase 2-B-like [Euwallacea fornicatus]|uniref:fatty-acid amide hydrolase 2-B-like n=1 Tax=Euwallacea fornicatus TaxID=995702 RepID=UPI00338E5D3D